MKKAIVTGATGYLGSKITSALVSDEVEVLCPIVRCLPMTYLSQSIDKITFLYTDSTDYLKIISDFSPDVVIHTACRYERDGVSLEELLDANMIFPLRIMHTVCQKENKTIWLNADTALDRYLNGYALSKHHFAEWGEYYAKKGSIHFINIILEQFYGKGDSGSKFIPFLLGKMKNNEPIDLTDGEQRRDFIYVDDVVSAFLFLAKAKLIGFHEIPLGTGYAPKIREVVEYLKKQTGSESELRFGAIPRRLNEPDCLCADTKLIEDLGLKCTYDWESGLKKLLEY